MNKNILVGIGVVVLAGVGYWIYSMTSSVDVDNNMSQEETVQRNGERPTGQLQREQNTEQILFTDIQIGQNVMINGTTTATGFEAETVTVMTNDFGLSPDGTRPPQGTNFNGQRPSLPEGVQQPSGRPNSNQSEAGKRLVGEITAINETSITIKTMDEAEEQVLISENTKFTSL